MTATLQIDWDDQLRRHDRWLRLVVLARTRERQAVDEVMQEVSLAAVEQRSPVSDPASIASWLYRLAVLKALLYRRGMGRKSKLEGRYADRIRVHEPDKVEPDPLSWLLDAERHQLVRDALARLPPRDAEVLILKYAEGWTYRELAEHLGQSEPAVESRLHRARQKLRQELTAARVIEVDP